MVLYMHVCKTGEVSGWRDQVFWLYFTLYYTTVLLLFGSKFHNLAAV